MKANSHAKIQHYVPQFVLKRFTERKEQINVYDKSGGKQFKSNVRKTGAESKFYDFSIEGIELTLERSLSEAESRISPLIKKIVREHSLAGVIPQQKADLSDFISLQYVRVPHSRNRWKQMGKALLEALRKRGVEIDNEEIESYGSPEEIRLQHIQLIKEHQSFTQHFYDKKWVLFKTHDKAPFWTSDNPVVLQNLRDFGLRGNIGLAVDGIEIYFPLSKNLCLAMLCPTNIEMIERLLHERTKHPLEAANICQDWNSIINLHKGYTAGTAVDFKVENVVNLNSLQVKNSSRFLFSSSSDFTLVKTMVSSHPEYKEGPKIIVS